MFVVDNNREDFVSATASKEFFLKSHNRSRTGFHLDLHLVPLDPAVIDHTIPNGFGQLVRHPRDVVQDLVIPLNLKGPKHHSTQFHPNSLHMVELAGMLSEKIPCFQVSSCQGPQVSLPLTSMFIMWMATARPDKLIDIPRSGATLILLSV